MKHFPLLFSVLLLTLSVCEAADDYTIVRKPSGEVEVTREVATPSGDWVLTLKYTYGKSGDLTKIISEFGTINGYDSDTLEFHPTSCLRVYAISEKKKLILTSEVIKDATTGKAVKRTFWSPEIDHWMNLRDLPEQSKQ